MPFLSDFAKSTPGKAGPAVVMPKFDTGQFLSSVIDLRLYN
jgi:hypothetical protein